MLLRLLILTNILVMPMSYALAAGNLSSEQINRNIHTLNLKQKNYTNNLTNLNNKLDDLHNQEQSAEESSAKLLIQLEKNLPITKDYKSLLTHESSYTNNAIAKHNLANLLIQKNQQISLINSNITQVEQKIKRVTIELAITNKQLVHQKFLAQQQIEYARELLNGSDK